MIRNNGHIHAEDDFSRRETRQPSRLVPFALGAIIGGVIGATIAILYAPAEGAELRRGMSETLDDITQGAKDIIRGAKTTAEKLFREGLDEEGIEYPLSWSAPASGPTIFWKTPTAPLPKHVGVSPNREIGIWTRIKIN